MYNRSKLSESRGLQENALYYIPNIQLYRYRTGTVLVPAARYQLVQYEAPIQTVRAVRGRVPEPSVLVETLPKPPNVYFDKVVTACVVSR
jgi:hypothetical protein